MELVVNAATPKAATPNPRRSSSAKGPDAGGPIPPGLVKLSTAAILPWTVGALLSPLQEPHFVLIALPPLALLALLIAFKRRAGTRRPGLLRVLAGLLLLGSVLRFLVVPAVAVLGGGAPETLLDLDNEEARWARLGLALGVTHVIFHVAALGILGTSLWMLATRRWIRDEPG